MHDFEKQEQHSAYKVHHFLEIGLFRELENQKKEYCQEN